MLDHVEKSEAYLVEKLIGCVRDSGSQMVWGVVFLFPPFWFVCLFLLLVNFKKNVSFPIWQLFNSHTQHDIFNATRLKEIWYLIHFFFSFRSQDKKSSCFLKLRAHPTWHIETKGVPYDLVSSRFHLKQIETKGVPFLNFVPVKLWQTNWNKGSTLRG